MESTGEGENESGGEVGKEREYEESMGRAEDEGPPDGSTVMTRTWLVCVREFVV